MHTEAIVRICPTSHYQAIYQDTDQQFVYVSTVTGTYPLSRVKITASLCSQANKYS